MGGDSVLPGQPLPRAKEGRNRRGEKRVKGTHRLPFQFPDLSPRDGTQWTSGSVLCRSLLLGQGTWGQKTDRRGTQSLCVWWGGGGRHVPLFPTGLRSKLGERNRNVHYTLEPINVLEGDCGNPFVQQSSHSTFHWIKSKFSYIRAAKCSVPG